MIAILSFILKLASGPVIDKALSHMERRAELENDRDRLKHMAQVEIVKQLVAESKVLAEDNRLKMSFPWFPDIRRTVHLPAGPVVGRGDYRQHPLPARLVR